MKTSDLRLKFRKQRIRFGLVGTPIRPRLSVYRSLKNIYAQVIDDVKGKTLVAASSQEKSLKSETGVKVATKVGELIGKKTLEKGIKKIVFDRGGRPYHGQIKAVAEGARKAGLQF